MFGVRFIHQVRVIYQKYGNVGFPIIIYPKINTYFRNTTEHPYVKKKVQDTQNRDASCRLHKVMFAKTAKVLAASRLPPCIAKCMWSE